jgi:hypothetical protein
LHYKARFLSDSGDETVCSGMGEKVSLPVIFSRNILPGERSWNRMTDSLKVTASKAMDDARVAAHAIIDDASVAAHNIVKDGEKEVMKGSDEVKIGVHKAVADARIAAHEAVSKIKKK